MTDFTDVDELNRVYFPEIEEYIKNLTGADKVLDFNCLVRHANPQGKSRQPPASDVHSDMADSEAVRRANLLLTEAGDPDYKYKRVLYTINWRAFSQGPQDWPLAVCDGRSVENRDFRPGYVIYVDEVPHESEIPPLEDVENHYYAACALEIPHKQTQGWWYFSNMKKDELLSFKYDSDKSNVWAVPHYSFQNDIRGCNSKGKRRNQMWCVLQRMIGNILEIRNILDI